MYKATNIDINKFLDELDRMQRDASYTHLVKNEIEKARFEQERKTLDQVTDMFYCSNYEKEGKFVTEEELNNIVKEKLLAQSNELLNEIANKLKSEDHLLYGADGKKKICNISYEELDKILFNYKKL